MVKTITPSLIPVAFYFPSASPRESRTLRDHQGSYSFNHSTRSSQYLYNKYQVRILAFDNYQRCPVPLNANGCVLMNEPVSLDQIVLLHSVVQNASSIA